MQHHDDMIHRALADEDRDLLARHAEPGYPAQALALFRGRLGWVTMLAYVTALAAFIGFGYTFWRAWSAEDALAAVKFGTLSVVLFQYTAMAKGFLGSHMEANRTLREMKRIELQMALLRQRQPATE
jgi:hypothetical protein